ncbi:AraC family transcriptional regulator [Paenibacillus anaericanus]|uniref:AraC family transcriptional regulator n=1 Tax=Paenibacillus anaericanus TaxID=170367 RepID=A0A433Y706_9BACL|nr:AraC family transcriptional regulator [Paenibacillus anaericanus]RUT45161.1 AraC family transcriptional regulator [Paenibacillus anaericanus]
MSGKQPDRLQNVQYMSDSSPFRIFYHQIDGQIDVHWHEFFEMALVIKGNGIHILNGTQMPLTRGHIFLMTPADFHELVPDPGQTVELYNLIFTQHFLRPELFQWLFQNRGGDYHQLPEEDFQTFEAEFRRLWEESEDPQEGSGYIIQGALERVLIDLRRQLPGRSKELANAELRHLHPSIRSAITYIQHLFRDSLTLDQVAKNVGLSANYFSECFRKQVGVSFQTFLQEQRLQFAHSLLRVTTLPVTEICFASGFSTLNHFERTFKKKYGQTPRELRKVKG